jgi:hypothetical protein
MGLHLSFGGKAPGNGFGRMGLKEARDTADDVRRQIRNGIDPIAARRQAKLAIRGVPTFAAIAAEVITDAKRRSTNDKVHYQWELLLGPKYCQSLRTYRSTKLPRWTWNESCVRSGPASPKLGGSCLYDYAVSSITPEFT